MRVPTLGSCVFSAVFLAAIARADVLDVGGPAPDHAQISAAVNAAQDGDVIRIWPGNYLPFTVPGKSLSLVEATTPGAVQVLGTIRIRELGPDQSVLLSGIDATGTDGRGLVVSDCLGSVRIREGAFQGSGGFGIGETAEGRSGALIVDCRDVELNDCSLYGGHGAGGGEYAGSGGHGLELDTSTLSTYHSHFEGGGGGWEDDPGASGAQGGHGIAGWGNSRAYISGCTLVGGHGGPADYGPDPWYGEYGYGGDGGWGYAGFLTEAWFLDNTIQPGTGGWGPIPGHQGSPGGGTTGGTALPGVSRRLRASALPDDVSDILLRFDGAPGDQVFLRIAAAPDYQFSPTLGPSLITGPPLTPFGASNPWGAIQGWRSMGTIGASGVLLASLPARELPDLGHAVLHFQAGYVGVQTYLGSSSWSTVLDTTW